MILDKVLSTSKTPTEKFYDGFIGDSILFKEGTQRLVKRFFSKSLLVQKAEIFSSTDDELSCHYNVWKTVAKIKIKKK